jgi:hypothetical protein
MTKKVEIVLFVWFSVLALVGSIVGDVAQTVFCCTIMFMYWTSIREGNQ